MDILKVRHNWLEKPQTVIERKNGADEYVFLHFLTPVNIMLNDVLQYVEANHFIIFEPHFPTYYKCPTELCHNWIHFFGNDVSETLKSFQLIPNHLYRLTSNGQFIMDIVRSMELEHSRIMPYKQEMAHTLLTELFIHLARDIHSDMAISFFNGEQYPMLHYLRNLLPYTAERDWTVAEMASYVGLSESRFQIVYKQLFGISPIMDLTNVRMSKAKHYLLTEKGYTVKKIAQLCGYHSEYHFIRQFKKQTDMTPRQYRIKNLSMTDITNIKETQ